MSEPFLKWAGGKRWLVQCYSRMFPEKYERYIEPFLGSGAVFFHVLPSKSILSDRNKELIETYKTVRESAAELEIRLKRLQSVHNADFYYKMRKSSPLSPVEKAARFLYLNRTCFNGLYRVNLKNEFNVPIGSKVNLQFPDNLLQSAGNSLRHAKLKASDFEAVIDQAGKEDFLYVDPPYTVMHNNNGFIKYNDVIFSWEDQIRLAKSVERASRRGAYVFVSNANHDAINELYKKFCYHHKLTRSTTIAASRSARTRITESAFLNYPASSLRTRQLDLI